MSYITLKIGSVQYLQQFSTAAYLIVRCSLFYYREAYSDLNKATYT